MKICWGCNKAIDESNGIRNGKYWRGECKFCSTGRWRNYERIRKSVKKYPCETCGIEIYKTFKRAFCSLKCRLMGFIRKEDECWIWIGMKSQDGYGKIGHNGKDKRAHRVSYELFNSPIKRGLYILHKCHKPLCVNPEHLYEGTAAENSRDTVSVDHQRKGETVGNSKLRDEDIKEIRRLYKEGKTQREIGEIFNVNQTLISFIVRKVYWKHVED